MAFEFSCRDAGADCDYVCTGKTEEELFENARKHAKEAHGLTEIPEDLKRKIVRLLRENKAA